MVRVFILLLLFLLSFQAVPAYSQDSEIRQSKEELAKIRERLEECRRRKEEIGEEEKVTLNRLEIVTEGLRITGQLIAAIKKEETSLRSEIGILQKKVEGLETDLESRKSILARRLREMYKHGRIHDLELMLLSGSLSDVLKKMKYIVAIAEHDEELIGSIRETVRSLENEKRELADRAAHEKRLKNEKENQKVEMEKEKTAKEVMLERLSTEKDEKENLERELEEVEKRVVSLIERLERESASREAIGGVSLSTYKGRLPWPVDGKVVSKFGKQRHPIHGTVTENNGIDIEARYGMPVRAVSKGKVVYADRFLGYSRVVLLDHGEGYYTLYAYLSDIVVPVGVIVDRGDVIAYVGDSFRESLLHFEVRKKGQPEDPLQWLIPR